MTIDDKLLNDIVEIAVAAGQAIMAVYERPHDEVDIDYKADDSPLTQADLAAHRLIKARLAALDLQLPLLSEESSATVKAQRRDWARYWLVDPLDGTKEFIKRNGEFTVNIALIDGHDVALGVVHAPVLQQTFYAAAGQDAWRIRDGVRAPLHATTVLGAIPRVVCSRSHPTERLGRFLSGLGEHRAVPMGSSLKICTVAAGEADIYPRLGPTCEWDIAAAQAVVEQAGGALRTLDGQPMRYNAKDELLNPEFIVVGDTNYDWLAKIPAAT